MYATQLERLIKRRAELDARIAKLMKALDVPRNIVPAIKPELHAVVEPLAPIKPKQPVVTSTWGAPGGKSKAKK